MEAPLVHGLCALWLTEAGTPAPGAGLRPVLSPADLPDAEVTLHWFELEERAEAFAAGVLAAGSNAATVVRGEDALACAAVLIRFDRAARQGDTLDAVVELVDHGGGKSAVWENLNRAAWKRISEELERSDSALKLHWQPGQGVALIEGMSQRIFIQRTEDGGYLMRPSSWTHRKAFDGSYGAADSDDVRQILAKYGASIVAADMWSTPPTVDLHLPIPLGGISDGIQGMESLLAELGAIHDRRKADFDTKEIHKNPAQTTLPN